MAVSKRTRFEVLRRDNYTCRYCRSTENQLTVDHVTPVALGGTDDPSNQSGAHHQQGKGTTMYRLLSLAAVLALTACSSAAPTAATTPTPSAAVITVDPTPSATATATATPTPTVWTKTEAAAQYPRVENAAREESKGHLIRTWKRTRKAIPAHVCEVAA